MAAVAEITDDLTKLLEKHKLRHLLENFQREKVTVDVISKFSSREMECLGIIKSILKSLLILAI